jgi:hypothetical protein
MVVAKSNRRKRQDRVKAGAKRAEQTRHRAKAERERQTAERYRQLLDPRTSPVDVAGILAAELPDSLVAGAMMQIRLGSGVPGGCCVFGFPGFVVLLLAELVYGTPVQAG